VTICIVFDLGFEGLYLEEYDFAAEALERLEDGLSVYKILQASKLTLEELNRLATKEGT
jgi:hypothetical protein